MDTRTKIVDASRAAEVARDGALVVSGFFDPLLAGHADRLAAIKREGDPLLVLIHSNGNAVLPADARARLVAALAVVDYVCAAPDGIEPQISLDSEHAQTLAQLIDRVHARQRAAS